MMIAEFCRNLLLPYGSLKMYNVYLIMWQQIVQYDNVRCKLLMHTIMGLALFQATKYLYLYIEDPPEVVRIVLYDGLYLQTNNQRGGET